MKRTYDKNADSLRGLAIILVILLHVTANARLVDIKPSLEIINYIFQNVRIPLFTVISGYFYAYLNCEKIQPRMFISGKIKKLIIPMYCVLLAELTYLYFSKGMTINELWPHLIFSYDHYWFVQAIILIFSFHTLAVKFNIKFIVLFGLAAFLYLTGEFLHVNSNIFSIGGALYLYPYFLTGIMACKLKELNYKIFFNTIFSIGIAFLLIQFISYDTAYEDLFSKRTLMGLLIGIFICSYLLTLNLDVTVLKIIGKYSFPIYILQAFGIKVGTIIASKVPGINSWLFIILVTLITIAFGITFTYLLKRSKKIVKGYFHKEDRAI